MTTVGIHDIALATGHYALDLAELADHMGIDVQKFYVGIGQQIMSVPAADEDVVTMAATAARDILDRNGADGIRTILFATETGVDQSKAAGVFMHGLLGLPSSIRVVELKQACYSATAAIQMAAAMVARDPSERVLVVASDVARYDLGSSGEPTQGAGAVAMLITADPAILALDAATGVFTADISDFWRPNYRSTAIVDGKSSVTAYMDAVTGAWKDYRSRGGRAFEDLVTVCYHQPFTKMAIKAHRQLAAANDVRLTPPEAAEALADTIVYNRVVGNSYTASMYVALLSLLDHRDDLAGQAVAFASYGSGSVAEVFTGVVQPGYQDAARTARTRETLDARAPLDYTGYVELHEAAEPRDGSAKDLPVTTKGRYRLAAYADHRRIYVDTETAA